MSISSNAANLAQLKLLHLLFGIGDRAVMGDNAGNLRYSPQSTVDSTDLGVFPVRLLDGLDANGYAIPGTVVPMISAGGFFPEYGLDIIAHKTPSCIYVYGGLDNAALLKRGKNPAQYTNTQATPKIVFRRNIQSGKHVPDVDSSGDYTQKVRRYGYGHIGYDGTRHDLLLGSSNALDFTDDFPAATFERYALTYYDPVYSVTGYVLTDSQTVTNTYGATEADALIAKLPHQLCQPGEIFRLDGNKGALDQSDNRGDFRELFSAPQPNALPNHMVRNWIYLADYQNIVYSGQTIADGISATLQDDALIEIIE